MKALVENIKPNFPGMISYIDTHDKLFDILKSPSEYSFVEARRGCCGTGLLETAILCNPSTISCADPSKYVFWDSFHPTTECYKFLVNVSFQ
ncbi:hypothetical protein SUGI_0433440 [Cryptomeria japonica]|nr:hypothetical protein SUGI_0433440 [Cryptomeria japonica]